MMFEGIDFSKMGDMLNDVQKKAKEFEAQNEALEFEAKSGGGLIVAKANGNGEILDITIDDSLLEDKESLQILLISAINELSKKVEEGKKEAAARMLRSFGGFGA